MSCTRCARGTYQVADRWESVLWAWVRVWGQTWLNLSVSFPFTRWGPLGKSHSLLEMFLICSERIFASQCRPEAYCDSYKALDSQSITCKWPFVYEWPCPPSRMGTRYARGGRETTTQLCFESQAPRPHPHLHFLGCPTLPVQTWKGWGSFPPERTSSAVGKPEDRSLHTVTNSPPSVSSAARPSPPPRLPHLNTHPANPTQGDPVHRAR